MTSRAGSRAVKGKRKPVSPIEFFLKPKLNDYATTDTSTLAIRTIIKNPSAVGSLEGHVQNITRNISNIGNLCKKPGFFVGDRLLLSFLQTELTGGK